MDLLVGTGVNTALKNVQWPNQKLVRLVLIMDVDLQSPSQPESISTESSYAELLAIKLTAGN